MDHLEQAKTLYRKRHDHASVISAEDHASLSMSITKMIRTCLMQHGGVASFKYLPFIHVIRRTVSTNFFQGDRAAMAFNILEKYLLLLVASPWKREFWLLKTYGGFFRAKVKAHLDKPEDILELVGYVMDEGSPDDSCLVLHQAPDTEIVLNVAFDCQVAAVECQYIGEYYEKMKCVGLELSDAMNVLLSGVPNDPLVGSPVVVLQGKNLQAGNNHYAKAKSDLSKRNTGKVAPPVGAPQMIMASGGMGMGVVTGMSSTHQVTGVPPAFPAGHTPVPHPYPNMADQLAVGLKVDLPQLRPTGRVVEPACRPPSIASQMPGSRASYGSSAYAPSSGYGSGSASVLSVPSSANTASSGYVSGAPPQTYNNNYLTEVCHGDHVDAPHMVALPQHTAGHRHFRQQPLPQQPAPNFPFIDEDETGSTTAPFPEATHEEHLRESLRNLRDSQPDKNRSKTLPIHTTSSKPLGRGGPAGRDGVPVSYDDWHWFRKDRGAGVPPGFNTMAGTGGSVVPQSNMGQRHVYHPSEPVPLRPSQSQPATAVTAMLAHHPHPVVNNMDLWPAQGHHQRAQSGDYPPLTVVSNNAALGPLSELAMSRDKHVTNASPLSNNLLQEGNTHRVVGSHPQPVYYPPVGEGVPFQHYTTTVAGPPLPQRQTPTFAQMAAVRRPDNSALLSRQAQAQGAATAVMNNLDKGHQGKTLNVGREGSGSSSEVIMRDKTQGKLENTRSSSLVTSHPTNSSAGVRYNRQSSRSMDLGLQRWKCRTCTMENSAAVSICVACSKSRDAPDVEFPAAGESKLMCPSCTFENPPGVTDCEVCHNSLPQNVHTYV